MHSTAAGTASKSLQEIQTDLLERVHHAKAVFNAATPDTRVTARESYVRALDALNIFLRSKSSGTLDTRQFD